MFLRLRLAIVIGVVLGIVRYRRNKYMTRRSYTGHHASQTRARRIWFRPGYHTRTMVGEMVRARDLIEQLHQERWHAYQARVAQILGPQGYGATA